MNQDDRPTAQPVVSPLRPGAVALLACLGLVAGWLSKFVAESVLGNAPTPSWPQAVVYVICAAALTASAIGTSRSRDGRARALPAQSFVNRLLISRSAALASSFVGAAYVGFAISWWRSAAELAGSRMLWSLVSAAACGGVLLGAIALERACRIPPPKDQT